MPGNLRRIQLGCRWSFDDGSIAIDRILFSDTGTPPDSPNRLVIRMLDDPALTTPTQLAEQYGKLLRALIGSQLTQFKLEKNRIKKTKISQNIGYLIQVLGSLIKEEKQVDERIAKIEEYLKQQVLVKDGYGR